MSAAKSDFLIVGAGAAGCALAWRLSRLPSRPTITLLEAGGENTAEEYRISGDRFIHRMMPGLNWGYETEPQIHCSGRKIDYARGKGLGGSTAINFCAWNVGPESDWEEMAKRTGQEGWKWKNAQRLLKELEQYGGNPKDLPHGASNYLKVNPNEHGQGGPLKVGFCRTWEQSTLDMIDAWVDAGYPLNYDLGTGDNMGIGMCPNTAVNGRRSTGADLLHNPPSNLNIITGAHVHKILFQGKKAVGALLLDGRRFLANKEVVLTSGSLNTPKILMHSGIGPRDQLQKFGLELLHENASVGNNLKDHCHVFLTWKRTASSTKKHIYYNDPQGRDKALKQWQKDGSGPLSDTQAQFALGFFRNEAVEASSEFAQLPEEEKRFLENRKTPLWELGLGTPVVDYLVDPLNTPPMESMWGFLYNLQGSGTTKLQSADPSVPLLFDPNLLSHPYDRKLAVEVVREILRVANGPRFSKDTISPVLVPKSDSEEDILQFWADNLGSTWHMTGTCKMGRDQGQDEAVVDGNFKVHGVDGLRVVDMSVVPIIVK